MGTNVYVDGFNFYNRVFKHGTAPAALKWVDLGLLAETVWPALAPIHRIRYFTAMLKPTPSDPQMPVRQQAYLRALRAKSVEIHLGLFRARRKVWNLRGVAAQQPPSTEALVLSAVAEVGKYEEKGSDVNLASYLIRDAALQDCDKAIVISNDSDLANAVRITRDEFNVPVYIINPQQQPVRELRQASTDLRDLKMSALQKAQLPAQMTDAVGQISKPTTWV